jgi:hypothetical protein
MGGGVGRVAVGPEISLGFYDAAGKEAGGGAMDQELAEEARGNEFRLSFKERSWQQGAAREGIIQVPSGDRFGLGMIHPLRMRAQKKGSP